MARVKIIGDGTPAGTTVLVDGQVRTDIQAIGFGIAADDIFCHLQLVISVEDIEIDIENNNAQMTFETIKYHAEDVTDQFVQTDLKLVDDPEE